MAKGGWSIKLRRVGKIRPVMAGIVGITKGGAVQSMLMAQGAAAAARCNSMARLTHGKHAPLYDCQLKMLDHTASARVGVANREAYVDNLKHNTLKKGCGV